MNKPSVLSLEGPTLPFECALTDESQIGLAREAVRRALSKAGGDQGRFTKGSIGDVCLVMTELAANPFRHIEQAGLEGVSCVLRLGQVSVDDTIYVRVRDFDPESAEKVRERFKKGLTAEQKLKGESGRGLHELVTEFSISRGVRIVRNKDKVPVAKDVWARVPLLRQPNPASPLALKSRRPMVTTEGFDRAA